MSASLVGSEMCIRDSRVRPGVPVAEGPPAGRADVVEGRPWPWGCEDPADRVNPEPVDLAHQPGRTPALSEE
eukprot:1969294-Alexandrium_andersonii.AAC.1